MARVSFFSVHGCLGLASSKSISSMQQNVPVVFSGKCTGRSRWLRPQVWVSGLDQWFSNCLLGCITDNLAPEGLPEVGPDTPGDSNVQPSLRLWGGLLIRGGCRAHLGTWKCRSLGPMPHVNQLPGRGQSWCIKCENLPSPAGLLELGRDENHWRSC